MASSLDCSQNIDPLKLVDGGTSQQERVFDALDPAYAPVNEHGESHGIVFAQAYAAFLKYYDSDNVFAGDWTPMFKNDLSAHLAFAAIQHVEFYRQSVKGVGPIFLNDRGNSVAVAELRNRLDYLFQRVCDRRGANRSIFKKVKEDLDQKRLMDASSPADENIALPATDEIARFALTLAQTY
jgi:hypothetical protein